MAGNSVPREVTLERERQAWSLRQDMKTQTQIAIVLKMSQSGVGKLLRRVEDHERKRLEADVSRVMTRHTRQLERIASDAWAAWEASREPTVTTRRNADGVITETSSTTNAGNPTHLKICMDTMKSIREIWGIGQLPPPARSPLEGWTGNAADLFKEFSDDQSRVRVDQW